MQQKAYYIINRKLQVEKKKKNEVGVGDGGKLLDTHTAAIVKKKDVGQN